MKNKFIIVLDVAAIIFGLGLFTISVFSWANAGFQIESLTSDPSIEGRMSLGSMLLGIGFSSYAFFDLLIFRKK
jgi:Na+/H+ antiporter NhaA